MKIAVVGCGAMGSVYAGRFAQAGNEVVVVDTWQEHVDRINDVGLRVTGPESDVTSRVRAVIDGSGEIADLIILSVKASDIAVAAQQVKPMLGPHTLVVTIQNGLGSGEALARIIGSERLVVGIAQGFGASLQGPGHARHNAMRSIRFGPYAELAPSRVTDMACLWRQAGFDAEPVEDIVAMQWNKLICNVAYSAPCLLTGLTLGQVIEDPDIGPMSRAAAEEAWRIARAAGIPVADDPVANVVDFGKRMPQAKPSALLDYEAGRQSEIDVINGAVPIQAAHLGTTAPVNQTLTALVRFREQATGRRSS